MPVVKTVSHPLDRLDFCRRHFAAENGGQDFTILHRFRPLHTNGKTVRTTSAAAGFAAALPPASPKEQNGMLRSRA